MRSRAKFLNTAHAVAVALLTSTGAVAQTAPDLKGQVIQSAAKVLGTASGNNGDSVSGLRAAQAEADRAFNCQAPARVVMLPDLVSNSVAERIRNDLLAGSNKSVVLQRPQYAGEIIATAVASFELGRIMSLRDQEKAALCAAPAPQPPVPAQSQEQAPQVPPQ